MHSLRRQYPQIYESSDKLVIDVSKLVVAKRDFYLAYKDIVPTGQRSNSSVAKPLSDAVFSLVGFQFEAVMKQLVFVFPQSWKCVVKGFEDVNERAKTERKKRKEMEKSLSIASDIATSHNGTRPLPNNRALPFNSIATSDFPLFSKSINGVFFDFKDSLSVADDNDELLGCHPTATTSSTSNGGSFWTNPHTLPNVHRPRLLLTGKPGKEIIYLPVND